MPCLLYLPDCDAQSFEAIPTLYGNSTAPLVWVVDAVEEEVVNRDVPRTLNKWVRLIPKLLDKCET